MGTEWALPLASATVYAAAVSWAADRLPADGVALHLDVHGVVDSYGTRAQALTLFVVLGAFLLGLAWLCPVALRRLPSRLINMPYREYWSEPSRLPRFRRMMARDCTVVFSFVLLVLSYLPVDLTLTTLDPDGHGQGPFLAMIVLLLAGMGGYIGWMTLHRYRPDRDQP